MLSKPRYFSVSPRSKSPGGDSTEPRRFLRSGLILLILGVVFFTLLYFTGFSPEDFRQSVEGNKLTITPRSFTTSRISENQPLPRPLFRFNSTNLQRTESDHGKPYFDPRGNSNVIPTESIRKNSVKNDVTQSPDQKNRNTTDPTLSHWRTQIRRKISCFKSRQAALYLYHVRKAAGTTVREILRLIAFRQRLPFYETEGIVLNQNLLDLPELFSIITLRDPINRIISLYWYEHVGWYFGVLKQPHRCKTFQEWIDTWKDGSPYKNAILRKFPTNNYVEIENYYTKLLIGFSFNQNRELTREDLEKAKETLRKFDLLLITEWMNDESEHNIIHSLYNSFYLQNSNQDVTIPQKVKGDPKVKEQLSSKLAADEGDLRRRLMELNVFDIELFEYAKSLTALRLKEMKPLLDNVQTETEDKCSPLPVAFLSHNRQSFGVFQPPGHKGP